MYKNLYSKLLKLNNKYPNSVLLQILQSRRFECENQNTDPVVWTCHRIIKWIKEIDLKVPKRENSNANRESVGVGIFQDSKEKCIFVFCI